jgi:hypothetical protein
MTHDHGTRDLDEPRELTNGERDLFVAMVDAARMDCREDLRCQVLTAKASAECRLSCGSIVLSVDRERCGPASGCQQGVPSTAEGVEVDGGRISVLLHMRDGYARMIECSGRWPADPLVAVHTRAHVLGRLTCVAVIGQRQELRADRTRFRKCDTYPG